MNAESDEKISKHTFSIAYNGDHRGDNHTIDVETLAPALLAFGKLLREAGATANGKKSKSRVLVTSRFEDQCFQVNFEFIVSYYEQVRMLVASAPIQTAKEVLEWVGLVKPVAAVTTGYLSYLGYLKWKDGKNPQVIDRLVDQDGNGNITVQIPGEQNQVTITTNVFQMAGNPNALAATRNALTPIGVDSFERIEIKDDHKMIEVINAESTDAIIASCNTGIANSKSLAPDIEESTAWLSVYSPVYDENSDNWRFNYGKDHIYVDISETTIAADALKRGGAMMDDNYRVKLETTTTFSNGGKNQATKYKILEVVNFIPATPVGPQTEMYQSVEVETDEK